MRFYQRRRLLALGNTDWARNWCGPIALMNSGTIGPRCRHVVTDVVRVARWWHLKNWTRHWDTKCVEWGRRMVRQYPLPSWLGSMREHCTPPAASGVKPWPKTKTILVRTRTPPLVNSLLWIPDKLPEFPLSSFEWNCQLDLVPKTRRSSQMSPLLTALDNSNITINIIIIVINAGCGLLLPMSTERAMHRVIIT